MKKNVLKGALASVIVLTTVAFTANGIEKKKIDVKDSEVTWRGEKVTGFHTGTVELKEGHFILEDGELKGGEFVMDMSSIKVTDLEGENKGKLEGHLKSDDFFGVETYPTAKLVITSAAKKSDGTYGVVADLTIKEDTHPVTFNLDWNENSASTELSIDRSKYNVRYGSGSFFDNLGDKTIYDNFDLKVDLKF
ncbi:YceI family protein [Salegentibacter sediminis]|uniref:YceI family protein n=1 Tax=Salegentibacter sediminis TaxID=1930251 RepID=UPI0009BFF9A5|nr:YceI family protein [Salegentibacter sediminis]